METPPQLQKAEWRTVYLIGTSAIGAWCGLRGGLTFMKNLADDSTFMPDPLRAALAVLFVPGCTVMGAAIGPIFPPLYLVYKMAEKIE